MTGKKTEVSTDLRPPKNAEAGDENVAAAGIGRPTPVSQRQRLRNRHRPHAPSAKMRRPGARPGLRFLLEAKIRLLPAAPSAQSRASAWAAAKTAALASAAPAAIFPVSA